MILRLLSIQVYIRYNQEGGRFYQDIVCSLNLKVNLRNRYIYHLTQWLNLCTIVETLEKTVAISFSVVEPPKGPVKSLDEMNLKLSKIEIQN